MPFARNLESRLGYVAKVLFLERSLDPLALGNKSDDFDVDY